MSPLEAYDASYMRTAWFRYGSTKVPKICSLVSVMHAVSQNPEHVRTRW